MSSIHILTGAAGFIGSHLADALLARGDVVIGIDDLSLGTRRNVAAASTNPRFMLHECDLSDLPRASAAVETAHGPIDTLWHLAANSDIQAGVADPDVDFRKTFLTTYSAVQLCRRHGIRRVVFASTSAVYGELPGPLAEHAGPLFPISNYGAMKLASEATLTAATTGTLDAVAAYGPQSIAPGRGDALVGASGQSATQLAQLNRDVRGLRDAIYAHIGGWNASA